ncbi:MAG: tetratricopeptide repeat protein [Pyrinomonadaceae bacterium]
MSLARTLKVAAFGLLLLVGIFARANAAENWTEVRSRNFFLIGDAGEKDLRQAAGRLEEFREAFRMLFPQIKLDGGTRTNVVVFKNAASYAPFKLKRPDGSIDSAISGYFQRGEDVNYITLSAGEKPGAYGTIFHEYVHFLLDTNIGRSDIPPWLGEGLAEYFETLQFVDNQRVSLGAPPGGYLSLLRQSDLIPFKTFFATDNSSLHKSGDEARGLFYAQAWALTHYLLHAGPASGRLEELLAFMKKSDITEKEFQQLFRSDYTEAEKALRKYIDQALPPNRIVFLPQKLSTDISMSVAPLSESQRLAYLGDLLYHTGDLAEAENLLRKALKADANSTIANMSLGLTLAAKKKFAEAKKYLEKAIASDRTNHLAYFNYAYAVSRESVDESGNVSEFPPEAESKMRDSLLRAIELAPGFAESYRLLAFVNLVNDTDLAGSVTLLKKGLEVRPGDQNIRLLLAQVLLRQEKYGEARSIAEKIAATASDAETWAGAQIVLQTVNEYFAEKAVESKGFDKMAGFGRLPPLILKRSEISDSDVEQYDEDRRITNLNLLIERQGFGERQVVGFVDRITCSNGNINFAVRSGGDIFNLNSPAFAELRLRVLTDGERSFTLGCGISLGKQLTVLTYRQSAGSKANVRGRLISIAFVPDFFRLKTAQEVANTRTVIIEDDRPFKSRPGKTQRPNFP